VRLYLRTYQFALLLGVCIALLVCDGFAAPTRKPAKDKPRRISVADSNQIKSAELDELTRAFAASLRRSALFRLRCPEER